MARFFCLVQTGLFHYSVGVTSRDASLWLSGASSVAGLVLAGVSVSIIVIAAANPPVLEHASAELQAWEAARVRSLRWLPVVSALPAVLCIAQVIARRPFGGERWTHFGVFAGWRVGSLIAMFACTVAVLAASSRGIAYALESIAASNTAHITDSPSFSGIGLGLSIMSQILGMLGLALFYFWWTEPRQVACLRADDHPALATASSHFRVA